MLTINTASIKTFVTGGTGLLGSHLLYELVQKGFAVKALKRNSSDVNQVINTFSYYTENARDLFKQIEWLEGDTMDYENLLLSMENVDKVYHLAAIVSFNKRDRQKMFDNNIQGTANIVNACLELDIEKLCFVSSVSAIGKPAEGMQADENTPWKHLKDGSAYGYSKFQSELEVWRGIEEGLNAIIVNPSIIIGPGNWDHGSSRMFPTVFKGMKYYTNGVTGYIDVRDVVTCMIKLMESEISLERFIVSAGNYSYKDVFQMIAHELAVKAPKKYASPALTNVAYRLDNLRSFITRKPRLITKEIANASHEKVEYNNAKIRERPGHSFIPVNEAIKHAVDCFKRDHLK
ncbi:MAG: NAD-dependent epimerase/dehydratase family protein [Bacteroidales bacterium]|nr:NAD-dependent epimerase/dehydratase family protein [Bacteroidales bacterium]